MVFIIRTLIFMGVWYTLTAIVAWGHPEFGDWGWLGRVLYFSSTLAIYILCMSIAESEDIKNIDKIWPRIDGLDKRLAVLEEEYSNV